MKNSFTASHRPDSLTGAIAAFEGINEACTLLNGPLGCKVYISYMASLLSPRLNTLAGRKIGMFANFKRASRPIVADVEKRLKAMYPDCRTSLFDSRGANVVETETKNREQFIAWAKGVDAVILAVGD